MTTAQHLHRAAAYFFLAAVAVMACCLIRLGFDSEALSQARSENETLRSQRDSALAIAAQQDSMLCDYGRLLECIELAGPYRCNLPGCVGGLEQIETWTLNDKER